jgi:hypothetical protein
MTTNDSDKSDSEAARKSKRKDKKEGPKRTVLNTLIYICGVLVIAAGLWLSYLGIFGHLKSQKVLALSVLFASLFFLLLGGYFYFLNQALGQEIPHTDNANPPVLDAFSSSLKAIVAPSRGERTAAFFWLGYGSRFGNTLSPIPLALFIEVTKLKEEATITTFSVDAQNKRGEWVRLLRMEVQDGTVFLPPRGDFKNAFKVELDTLESQIGKLEGNKSINGWAFFDTPDGFASDSPYRINIRDKNGAEHAYALSAGRVQTGDAGFKTSRESYDLSKFRQMFYGDVVGK